MKNYQDAAKEYLAKIKKIAKVKEINSYAFDLIKQIKEKNLVFNKKDVLFDLANEKDIVDLKKIIELAYYWRYTDGSNTELFDFEISVKDPNVKVFTAKYVLGKQTIILATMRLVRKEIEFFSFFELDTLSEWPYKKNGAVPYELGRLAFHPLFDFNKNKEFQNYLMAELYKKALAEIIDENYWLVVTMRKGIKSFISQPDIKFRLIEGLREADNETFRMLKKKCPKYFSQEFDAYELIN